MKGNINDSLEWYRPPELTRPVTLVVVGARGNNAVRNICPAVRGIPGFPPGSWEISVDGDDLLTEAFLRDMAKRNGMSGDAPIDEAFIQALLKRTGMSKADLMNEAFLRDLSARTGMDAEAARPVARYQQIAYVNEETDPDFRAYMASWEALGHLVRQRPQNQVVIIISQSHRYFEATLRAIKRHMPSNVRIILEKPRALTLAQGISLDNLIESRFRPGQVLRLDHYLGSLLAQEMAIKMTGSPLFRAGLDASTISEVHLWTDERRTLAGRHGFIDDVGSLADLLSHELMILGILLADPGPLESLHVARANLLERILPFDWTPDDVNRFTVRTRYRGSRDESRAELTEKPWCGANPDADMESGYYVEFTIPEEVPRVGGIKVVLSAAKAAAADEKTLRIVKKDGTVIEDNLKKANPRVLLPHGNLVLAAAVGWQWPFVHPSEDKAILRIVETIRGAWAQGASPVFEHDVEQLRSTDLALRLPR